MIRSDLLSNRSALAALLRKDDAQAFEILLLGTVISLAHINSYKNSQKIKIKKTVGRQGWQEGDQSGNEYSNLGDR